MKPDSGRPRRTLGSLGLFAKPSSAISPDELSKWGAIIRVVRWLNVASLERANDCAELVSTIAHEWASHKENELVWRLVVDSIRSYEALLAKGSVCQTDASVNRRIAKAKIVLEGCQYQRTPQRQNPFHNPKDDERVRASLKAIKTILTAGGHDVLTLQALVMARVAMRGFDARPHQTGQRTGETLLMQAISLKSGGTVTMTRSRIRKYRQQALLTKVPTKLPLKTLRRAFAVMRALERWEPEEDRAASAREQRLRELRAAEAESLRRLKGIDDRLEYLNRQLSYLNRLKSEYAAGKRLSRTRWRVVKN